MAALQDRLNVTHYKENLRNLREEIFGMRNRLDDSWKDLQEREVEFEETALKRQMSLGLEKLDEQQKKQIEAIDMALHRIETGDYGICLSCGEYISPGRLDAVPWTPVCAACAGLPQEGPAEAASVDIGETGLPPNYSGMSDEDMQIFILEKLRNDGRVELEELEITVDSGTVYLDGTLPGDVSREILLEILQDTLGIHDIEDRIRVDEVSWQRQDRDPGPDLKKTENEELLQGEDINEEIFHSRKSGKPVAPPDQFVPEEV